MQPAYMLYTGTANGELIMWDLNSNNNTTGSNNNNAPISIDPQYITVSNEFHHKEPILDINFIRNTTTTSSTSIGGGGVLYKYFISTIGMDGKLLYWSIMNKLQYPVKGYIIHPAGKHTAVK